MDSWYNGTRCGIRIPWLLFNSTRVLKITWCWPWASQLYYCLLLLLYHGLGGLLLGLQYAIEKVFVPTSYVQNNIIVHKKKYLNENKYHSKKLTFWLSVKAGWFQFTAVLGVVCEDSNVNPRWWLPVWIIISFFWAFITSSGTSRVLTSVNRSVTAQVLVGCE